MTKNLMIKYKKIMICPFSGNRILLLRLEQAKRIIELLDKNVLIINIDEIWNYIADLNRRKG
jgi:hypothetical protein